MKDPKMFETDITPTWCPGCGNFGIWSAIKLSLATLAIPNHKVAVVYGIGCHGNMCDFLSLYGARGLHGRALPLAQGLKIANSDATVIAVVGDGDCLGEGGNHLLHAAKRNPNITVIIHDNQVYALTTGQASPTAEKGFVTKSTPQGSFEDAVNPVALCLTSGATFVGRGFAGDIPGLSKIFTMAIKHRGFSVVDVLQPCVTFDPIHTYEWYRKRIYAIDPLASRMSALTKSYEWGEKIPCGIFFQEEVATSEDRHEILKAGPLRETTPGFLDREAFLQTFR